MKATIRLPGALVETTVAPVINNVWHYASTTIRPLDFVVRSADGKSAST